VAALVEIDLNLQGRKLVRHHAHAPALFVVARVAIAVGEDLVRCVGFAAFAKRTKAAWRGWRIDLGSNGTLGTVGGDDDPAAHNRILAQLRHRQTPERGSKTLQ